jgi:dihydrofolate reductase
VRLPLAIVVAMNRSRVIGLNGELPWHIPEDLRHFRRVTMGHAILMGRTTHESIGRALPGRTNVVITRQKGAHFEGCQVANSIEEAIEIARSGGDDEPRIIGGGTIYEQALGMITKLFITEVDLVVEGDTFFPQIDWSEWTEVANREGDGVVYRTLERR